MCSDRYRPPYHSRRKNPDIAKEQPSLREEWSKILESYRVSENEIDTEFLNICDLYEEAKETWKELQRLEVEWLQGREKIELLVNMGLSEGVDMTIPQEMKKNMQKQIESILDGIMKAARPSGYLVTPDKSAPLSPIEDRLAFVEEWIESIEKLKVTRWRLHMGRSDLERAEERHALKNEVLERVKMLQKLVEVRLKITNLLKRRDKELSLWTTNLLVSRNMEINWLRKLLEELQLAEEEVKKEEATTVKQELILQNNAYIKEAKQILKTALFGVTENFQTWKRIAKFDSKPLPATSHMWMHVAEFDTTLPEAEEIDSCSSPYHGQVRADIHSEGNTRQLPMLFTTDRTTQQCLGEGIDSDVISGWSVLPFYDSDGTVKEVAQSEIPFCSSQSTSAEIGENGAELHLHNVTAKILAGTLPLHCVVTMVTMDIEPGFHLDNEVTLSPLVFIGPHCKCACRLSVPISLSLPLQAKEDVTVLVSRTAGGTDPNWQVVPESDVTVYSDHVEVKTVDNCVYQAQCGCKYIMKISFDYIYFSVSVKFAPGHDALLLRCSGDKEVCTAKYGDYRLCHSIEEIPAVHAIFGDALSISIRSSNSTINQCSTPVDGTQQLDCTLDEQFEFAVKRLDQKHSRIPVSTRMPATAHYSLQHPKQQQGVSPTKERSDEALCLIWHIKPGKGDSRQSSGAGVVKVQSGRLSSLEGVSTTNLDKQASVMCEKCHTMKEIGGIVGFLSFKFNWFNNDEDGRSQESSQDPVLSTGACPGASFQSGNSSALSSPPTSPPPMTATPRARGEHLGAIVKTRDTPEALREWRAREITRDHIFKLEKTSVASKWPRVARRLRTEEPGQPQAFTDAEIAAIKKANDGNDAECLQEMVNSWVDMHLDHTVGPFYDVLVEEKLKGAAQRIFTIPPS